MATIQCVVKFINGNPKTGAHSENSVCEDIVHFDKIVKKKKEEEGNLWPNYRILNPDDDTLNTANFPNLAVAAVEYMKTFGPATYKNMVTPQHPVSQNIIRWAQTEDSSFTSETATHLAHSESALLGASIADLDIAKIQGTQAGRRAMDIEGPTGLEEFLRAFTQMKSPNK